ncbi:unnamed protein product [Mytilus coruscus]|uniref:Uncharacterized protein n=1 Tax=Mytilus coruscus TaxID=42192 RepID=A0A6J8EVJ5_MYTCO|nr:unnamed protein product [Mytilus coruscus]
MYKHYFTPRYPQICKPCMSTIARRPVMCCFLDCRLRAHNPFASFAHEIGTASLTDQFKRSFYFPFKINNETIETKPPETIKVKTDQPLRLEVEHISAYNTIDIATKTESNTLDQDTISTERTSNSDSNSCDGLFETKQITELHTESYPGPDRETMTPVEATNIETMETTETTDSEMTNASETKTPETTKPETTVTIEATDLQTRIAPVTSQSKGLETKPIYEAINLETRRKTEGIEIDIRIIPDITDHQTTITSEPTTLVTRIKFETPDVVQTSQAKDQKTRRITDVMDLETMLTPKATNKNRRKKSDGTFEIPHNKNSTLKLVVPKSGLSIAVDIVQKDSPETTDFKDVN